MTTDIVEWLRKEAELVALDRLNEAADCIERLQAELAAYKPRDDGTAVAFGGEPGASAGKSE